MKVLLVGDSPTIDTGFARCTRTACDALLRASHQPAVLGINESGDPQVHDEDPWRLDRRFDYPIFPARRMMARTNKDFLGIERVGPLAADLQPDLVALLNDPWNIKHYVAEIRKAHDTVPIVGWLAVDAENHPFSRDLNVLAHVIAWTDFARLQLRAGGYAGPCTVVPLGVDCATFHPMPQEAAREEYGLGRVLPADRSQYVVGALGRNQPRKRLDLTIAYFAEWIRREKIEDAWLMIHAAPTGERGCDIRALVEYYGLAGRAIVVAPPVGAGLPDRLMRAAYCSLDLYITTTQGEGWGLTTHEAMACGVPCVVPDWSALGEWTEDAAIKVRCTSTALSAPLEHMPYTVGGIADREGFISALSSMYHSRELRERYGRRGLELATRPEFRWDAVGARVVAVLESVLENSDSAAVA